MSVVALLLGGVGLYQTRNHPRGIAPAYTFSTLDQQPATWATYAGKPTVVVVWAPWCGVCKAESDNVSRARRWLGDGVNVISVATQYQSVNEVTQYMERQSVDYPVLLAGADFAQRMGVEAYPSVYVLNAEGKIVSSMQGYTTTLGFVVRAWWARWV